MRCIQSDDDFVIYRRFGNFGYWSFISFHQLLRLLDFSHVNQNTNKHKERLKASAKAFPLSLKSSESNFAANEKFIHQTGNKTIDVIAELNLENEDETGVQRGEGIQFKL